MNSIFSEFSSLINLPDISKLIANKVNNMSYIFSWCSSLSKLPDISKWSTNSVTNMSCMLVNVHHYQNYLIFENGIQIMLLI